MFELADVLVGLQALASQELEEHERAIRRLDLTEASVAEAKEGLDLVAEAIAVAGAPYPSNAPAIVSELASVAFEASVTASDNASDKTVQITIEGDRILLTENFAIAVAQWLAQPEGNAVIVEAMRPSDYDTAEVRPPARKRKSETRRQLKTRGRRPARRMAAGAPGEDPLSAFIARLEQKAPTAFADAFIKLGTSGITGLPKTLAGLWRWRHQSANGI